MMNRTLQLKVLVIALLALLLISGCGYHAVSKRGPLGDANGVNVALFANRTYRPTLEGILARDLVDQMALRTGGKVLPPEQAQLELTGTILSYNTVPVSYTSRDTIQEYRTVISVQAMLRDQQSKKVLWKGDLTESQTFPMHVSIALQQNAEEAAARKVCRRLSEEIWQKISEQF
jgi:outer membrane lipopolysaccharide assembly protein LptE/RlpB